MKRVDDFTYLKYSSYFARFELQPMRNASILREIATRVAFSAHPYSDRVVALNVLHETRAVSECEAKVQELLGASGDDIDRLSFALRSYLADHVRVRPTETFLRPENDSNAVRVGAELLVHVWNVEAFLTRLDENDLAAARFLDRNRLTLARSDLHPWLATLRNDSTRLREVLGLRNHYRNSYPRHPTWVGKWHEAEHLIDRSDANTWLQAMGLAPLNVESQYMMLLRYPASRPGLSLRRPTQFEAGWFALHFPSPPCASVNRGGFALLVDTDRIDATYLVSEYVHPEIDWQEGDVLEIEATRPGPVADLQTVRNNHLKRLQAEFGDLLLTWMTDPDRLIEASTLSTGGQK
jgi:hypothetical protein